MLNCIGHSILLTRRWSFSIFFLSLSWTLKPKYEMLVDVSLYLELRSLKVWRWLCLPSLQFRTLYCDFLHARRFYANLPAPLLALLWFLCFRMRGLDIQWGNIFNAVHQTWIIDVRKLVIFFFNTLLHFHDQTTRSGMSLKKDRCRM